MTVTEEAAEQAARAMAAVGHGSWEDMPDALRRAFLRDARLAVEASAPALMAKAWDEGWGEGSLSKFSANATNPYRSAL